MKRKTTEEFIKQAKLVHGDRYDYSNTVYVSAREKLTITCYKHGDFQVQASSHLKHGCNECGNEKIGDALRKDNEQFILDAKAVHGDKYDYSEVKYVRGHGKVVIICPVHGEFLQAPNNHLFGYGCKKCATELIHKNRRSDVNQFVIKANKKHSNFYNYSKVDYKTNHKHVIITCPNHGDFKQTPASHLSGSGCKGCADENNKLTSSGFTKKGFTSITDTAVLYLVEVVNDVERFLKVGITMHDIKKRFKGRTTAYKFNKIASLKNDSSLIWDIEKLIEDEFSHYKYWPQTKFAGYTECFSMEALPELKALFS